MAGAFGIDGLGANSGSPINNKAATIRQLEAENRALEQQLGAPLEDTVEVKGGFIDGALGKATDFVKEHPVLTEAGVFAGSAALSYGLTKHGGEILHAGKEAVYKTVGKVAGGVTAFAASAGLAANTLMPIIAGAVGGPAGIIVAGVGVLATTAVGAKVGSYIGEKLAN